LLLSFELEFLVNNAFEDLEWLRAADHAAVDEKRGRAVDASVRPGLQVRLNCRLELVSVDAGIELRRVESQLCSAAFEIGLAKLRRIAEQPVVIRPELSLLRGAGGRLGRRSRVGVVGQGVMTIDESDLVPVGLQHLIHGRRRAQAEGTLE